MKRVLIKIMLVLSMAYAVALSICQEQPHSSTQVVQTEEPSDIGYGEAEETDFC